MQVFIPTSLSVLFLVLTFVMVNLIVGFAITRIRKYSLATVLAWLLLIVSIVGIERFTHLQPPGFRMLSIILLTLFSMKVIVSVAYYKNKENKLSFIQWIAFSAGWFGMRPNLFESLGQNSLPGNCKLILVGLSKILIGLILLVFAGLISSNYSGTPFTVLALGFTLVGISLILHFGILNMSAGFWRLSGVDTRTLFRSPLLSTSLSEFWGRRWNIAFSEMTSIALYRPLKISVGKNFAMLIAFLFSGLLHEMAISIPVKAGYGLPMLYFLIHGFLMLVENGLEKKGIIIGKNKWIGRAWVIFWLLLPLPILFHIPFLKGVVLPIIR